MVICRASSGMVMPGATSCPSDVTIKPVAGPVKRPVARVGRVAGGQRDLEIAAPLDRDVEVAAGGRQRALGEVDGDRGGSHAQPDLHPGRHDRAVGAPMVPARVTCW
jgi:hypothetical protein